MASFFYFNTLSSWKWTFPEGLGGLCHTCGNSEGVGGHQFPAKMENPGRWGGPKWNSLCGGGLDIFWNYTLPKINSLDIRWGTKGNGVLIIQSGPFLHMALLLVFELFSSLSFFFKDLMILWSVAHTYVAVVIKLMHISCMKICIFIYKKIICPYSLACHD